MGGAIEKNCVHLISRLGRHHVICEEQCSYCFHVHVPVYIAMAQKNVFVLIASVSMSERCTSRQRRPVSVAVSGVISGHGALREDVEAGQLHVCGR